MKERKLIDYVEEEANKTHFIKARITPLLKERLDRVCKENGWKESHVVRGGIQKFLDECSNPMLF